MPHRVMRLATAVARAMHNRRGMEAISALGSRIDLRVQRALHLMHAFAQRTGVTSPVAPSPRHRSLTTDALAVCNLLSLSHATNERSYLELAAHLVELVHHTLGRHRSDDWREGWLSGLSELGANTHPTWGGLRIGKPLPERNWDQAFDERREHERDGQYFHALTRWMHALDQLSRRSGEPRYNRWARELAAVAFAAFTVEPKRGEKRLVWKMSIDLSRPQVSSEGQHDALEALLTCAQLQTTAELLGAADEGPTLREERAAFEAMTQEADWATSDPMGNGLLLTAAWRLRQLQEHGAQFANGLLARVLSSALEGLAHFAQTNGLHRPALTRLPSRELTLAVGLHALERLSAHTPSTSSPGERELLEALRPACALGAQIDSYWLEPRHRTAASWLEHREVNEVTLAASLCPHGYLELVPR